MTYEQFVKWVRENTKYRVFEHLSGCLTIDTREKGVTSGITWFIHDDGNVWISCDSYGDAVVSSTIQVCRKKPFEQIKNLINFIN